MKANNNSNYSTHEISQVRQQNEELKFDLFVQLRKVKQISQALDQLINKNADLNRPSWFASNVEVVDQLLEDLLDDSMLVLDGVQFDEESKSLSFELMGDIKETLCIINTLIRKNKIEN
ncbi:MAG: hypothetical protein U9O78_00580 [Patescibacteria group bacterium]|nr:hypothetical protein [Patescibacteria group bacterium]